MMRCEICGCMAHTRSSQSITATTTERYLQCTNINCGHTFVTMETKVRSIMIPGKTEPVSPHETPKGQQQITFL
ncbi:late control protein B [Serratia fonticola]|uniref:ogr/Delta-like zinc finger family protein n=1 Tax=Serratia fonticola TaxID=47917 RepID=UPI000BFDB40A|nr:ogr/Delta-like zinc finger family protein [Serratia fonticola]ATM79374.1 late control protein B [Serratia fonticola]